MYVKGSNLDREESHSGKSTLKTTTVGQTGRTKRPSKVSAPTLLPYRRSASRKPPIQGH